MKVIVENLSHLLGSIVKPSTEFVRKSIVENPIIKLACKKGRVFLESSTGDRFIRAYIVSTIKESGKAFIPSSAIAGLKSSHKRAIISTEKNKLVIKSGDSKRKMIVGIDMVSPDSYPTSIKIEKKKGKAEKIFLPIIQGALSRINISPIIVPGIDSSLVSIFPDGKTINVIVNDSYRILCLETKSKKMKIESELITDFQEINHIFSIVSSISKEASMAFNKKVLEVVGFDEDKSEQIRIRMAHNLPGTNLSERSRTIVLKAIKQKPVVGFIPDKSFKETLNNVISLEGSKGARSRHGYVDITVSNGAIRIVGSGASSTYKEILKIKKTYGRGTVRISSQVLGDTVRLMSDNPVIKVTKSSLVIKNKWPEESSISYFILPFLGFEKR